MTPRERLLATIRRAPTDRVPISLYELCQFEGSSYASFANHEPSYARLMRVMAKQTDCLMMSEPAYHMPDVAARTEKRTRREGFSVFEETVLHTPKGELTARTRRDDNIFTTWKLEHLLKTPADIDTYMSLDFSATVDTSKMARDLQTLGDQGLLMATVADPICEAAELFAMEDFLVLAITETDLMQRFLDWLWARRRHYLAMLLKAQSRDIVFRIVGPEYGTPPYLPDRYVHAFVTQYVLRMATMIREAGGIPRVHAHGKVRYLLGELAGSDVLCVDPVEPPPDGNIPLAEAKALYGHQFTLFGNIELKVLETAEPEQVDALVQSVMADAKAGGGFVLMPTATPINIPLSPRTEQNLITMIEAGHRYGRY